MWTRRTRTCQLRSTRPPRFGHVGIVRLLLENRAETTLKNQQGRTPLAIARRQGHEEVVAMLLVC